MDTKSTIEQFEQEYPTLAKSYKEILKQQYELFASKMIDYGLANIAQGNTLETPEEKKFSLTAIFIRMNDKPTPLMIPPGDPDLRVIVVIDGPLKSAVNNPSTVTITPPGIIISAKSKI